MLRWLGLGGLSLVAPMGFGQGRVRAAPGPGGYDGPLWIMVHASGGWDPTSLCDPKGRLHEDELDPMNQYFKDDIGQAGPFSYAPVEGFQYFFETYADRLLVLNGVDTETNSHEGGTRYTWSGQLGEGHPSLAAAIAAVEAPNEGLSFISNGGYDATAGLVAPTRVGSNTGLLTQLAYPEVANPSLGDQLMAPGNRFHTVATTERIVAARQARLERHMAAQRLPRQAQAMGTLYGIRAGESELSALAEYLPETLDNSNNPLKRQAQLAIASYRAGLTVSANLAFGSFDTHSNHDATHLPRLATVLEGVDFVMKEAEAQGIADKLVVVIGSDFGRTPGYNDGNGKDHWSITSMMMMGKGIQGGRLIGSTDDGHVPRPLDPVSLLPAEEGIRITPAHVHRSLRDLAGLAGTDVDQAFPVSVDALNLLGG
jgi:hypothetical protein